MEKFKLITLKVLEFDKPLTKEILDNNFTLDEKYYKKAFMCNDFIPYKIPIDKMENKPARSINDWDFIWNSVEKHLFIEDDPIITIETVNGLILLLKVLRINIELKIE